MDAGVFQTVLEGKTINTAMTKVSDQIGGGEDCASSELRHMRFGNGKLMFCTDGGTAASVHPHLIDKIPDVDLHVRSLAHSYPLKHFKYCIIV